MSAYLFYSQVRRAELRDPNNKTDGNMPTIIEVSKIVAEEWK